LNIKLAAYFTSVALIAFGVVRGGEPFTLAGASIFISTEIINLAYVYRAAKLFRGGQRDLNEGKSVSARIARVLRGSIICAGLIGVMMGQGEESSGFTTSAWTIWGGTIICFLVNGWIVREVAGIPLRMGYGEWYVARSRKARKSSKKGGVK
jgi:type IV secretory pathway TrbL component